MVATREGPDVSVKLREEFDDDGVAGLRDKVALRHFQFVAFERASSGQKMIAGSRSQNEKIGGLPFAFDTVAWFFAGGLHGNNVGLLYFAACLLRALEQETIQNFSRIDDDGLRHFESGALIVARDEFDGVNQFFGMGILEKKRVTLRCLVSEAAAARLFPRQMLIKNDDFVSRARQLLAAHRAGRPAADDRNLRHGTTSVVSRTGGYQARTPTRAGKSPGRNRRSV